jgi:PAS domain S-box-containing protein
VADHLTSIAAYAALLQEDLADLYEHAPCGYLSTNADGVILKVNATFLALTGHQRDALVGRRRFLELLTAGGRIFYETHLRPLLRMQGFAREIALDLLCADGRQLPILVNAVERRAESSGEAVIRITAFDATDRRRYERELLLARRSAEEAAQARSDLIAMVSHDVRAPLSAVVTAAAMLEKTGPTPQQARYLRIMQSSATHALTLLNSILDLSSLETGHAVLRTKTFSLRALCDQLAAGARLVAGDKHDLVVRASVDPQTPDRLVGDADKIAQVLMNLLGNAVKFTERGLVSLTVAPRETTGERVTLEFAVSDTGIGIAADRLPFIFNEFTQASAEIGEKYGGTGLGLAIARKLLRLHGAELEVTSTVGQGTTFTFVLELARAAPAEGDAA